MRSTVSGGHAGKRNLRWPSSPHDIWQSLKFCNVLRLPAMEYHVAFFWKSELAGIYPPGEWGQSCLIPARLNSLPLPPIYHRWLLVILRPFSSSFSTLKINLFGPLRKCSLSYFSPIKALHQWPSKCGLWPQWDIETLSGKQQYLLSGIKFKLSSKN